MIDITTNNVPRDVIEAYELSEKEQKEFDYIDWKKVEAGEDSASFMRYKGQLYDLSEFTSVQALQAFKGYFNGWDGYQSDTYFSGILVKYTDSSFESVIVGRYFAH